MQFKFIEEEKLREIVVHLLNTAHAAQRAAEEKLERNVIDPFATLFQMAGFDMTHQTWVEVEKMRQAEKSLQNSVGRFHQTILGSFSGWEDLGTGSIVDVVNHEQKIVAEVKNKYNTVSGGRLSDIYHELENTVMPKTSRYQGYTAYFVTIIPRKPKRINKPFTPSDRSKGTSCPSNEHIREIDGASFYDLASGLSGTLGMLYSALPDVIATCKKDGYKIPDIEKLKAYFSAAFGESC
jgi:hypothetical protein